MYVPNIDYNIFGENRALHIKNVAILNFIICSYVIFYVGECRAVTVFN
jgi:hypothetical protein